MESEGVGDEGERSVDVGKRAVDEGVAVCVFVLELQRANRQGRTAKVKQWVLHNHRQVNIFSVYTTDN